MGLASIMLCQSEADMAAALRAWEQHGKGGEGGGSAGGGAGEALRVWEQYVGKMRMPHS